VGGTLTLENKPGRVDRLVVLLQQTRKDFFPSSAFMAFARSFNMSYSMLQIGIN